MFSSPDTTFGRSLLREPEAHLYITSHGARDVHTEEDLEEVLTDCSDESREKA